MLSLVHAPSLPSHDPKDESWSQDVEHRDDTHGSLLTRLLTSPHNPSVSPALRSTTSPLGVGEQCNRPMGDSLAGSTSPRLADTESLPPTVDSGDVVCTNSTLDEPPATIQDIPSKSSCPDDNRSLLVSSAPPSNATRRPYSFGFANTLRESQAASSWDNSTRLSDAFEQLVVHYETDGGVRIAGGRPGERLTVAESAHMHAQTLTLPPPYSSLTADT